MDAKLRSTLITVGAIVAVLALFVGIPFGSYISANNYGARIESEVKAAWDNNRNVLAQYQQKILEAAQVPEMYKNDYKEVISADVQGRYGADGSKATMQWLKERNINFDSTTYVKMQQLIEAGRNDFKTNQTRLIEVKRQYEAARGMFWTGMWLRIAGFPRIDLDKYNIVTTDRTEAAFASGKESAPLKLR